MKIENCTKEDFDQILQEIKDFWGTADTLGFHHPIFLYEFGNTAFVIKKDKKVVAYLFGFLSQTAPSVGYVHLIGVRSSFQRRGLGQKLYKHFIEYARQQKCSEIKAITASGNRQSIAFHRKIGMTLLGKPEDETPVVKDYSGPGLDRVVFKMPI